MRGWAWGIGLGVLIWLASFGPVAWASEPAAAAAAGMGTLRAECARFRLTLLADGKAREVVGEKGSAAVPAGSYYLLSSEAEFGDSAGRNWRVRSGMVGAPIVVRAGETTTLALGSPIETRMTAHVENGKLVTQAEFWGPQGDKCDGVVVEGGALPAPRVRILDETGKVLARPEGGYCCHFTATMTWPLPPGLCGKLRIVPEITFGPVPVWMENAPTVTVAGTGEATTENAKTRRSEDAK